MAEAADELSTPLGRNGARGKRRFRLPFTGFQVLAAVLGLFLLTFAGYALFNDDPFGGEPLTRVAIGPLPGDDKVPAKSGEAAAEKMASHGAEPAANSAKELTKEPAKAAGPGERTVTIIDGSSGARHDVAIGGGEASEKEAGAAPAVMSGIDPKVLGKARLG